MIRILSPKSVTRGQDFKGVLEIRPDELEGAKSVEIIFYNSITFGRDGRNYSSWEFRKSVPSNEFVEKKEVPFEFPLKDFAPITYSGKSLTSKWRIKVKMDIPGIPDKEIEQEITVFR